MINIITFFKDYFKIPFLASFISVSCGVFILFLDIGVSFIAGRYLYKQHLDKKHTGGSFRESYYDNKDGD